MLKIIGLLLSAGLSVLAHGQAHHEIENQVEQVDSLRQALVQAVGKNPTLKTFKQVCSPVGLNIKRIAKEKNIKIRQASHKARNPENKANADELLAIEIFKKKKDLKSMWLNMGKKKHFFQKIVVQEKCLACHGPRAKRPTFVKDKYKQDQAFDFKVGDLRGVYHVESQL